MLHNLQRIWAEAGAAARAGLVIGVLAICAALAWALHLTLRSDYQVLFSELEVQDSATIAAELDRLKVPYRIGADETVLLVPAEQVHATRLKLMGKGVNLRGGVGLEIFANNDFGMTEFAQKVNYQRALQGELTRTIGALDEVRQVRVHLVLPEAGLFRRPGARPKAAVTLAMKRGRQVSAEQVLGIQRLVAAAVPEIDAGAVTIVDEQGHALTRPAEPDGAPGAEARISAKGEVEQALVRKVVAVLDRAFGPGQAIVTVDATLDHDQVRVTREDVIPGGARGSDAAGALTRRRMTTSAAPPAAAVAANGEAARAGATSSEVEYQNGRRVEQIVTPPGGVRQLSVGVLLPRALDRARLDELRRLIAASVGLNETRGDVIAISSLEQFGAAPAGGAAEAAAAAPPAAPDTAAMPPARPAAPAWALAPAWWAVLAGGALLLVLVAFGSRRARGPAPLSPQARERMLAQLRDWLAADEPASREPLRSAGRGP